MISHILRLGAVRSSGLVLFTLAATMAGVAFGGSEARAQETPAAVAAKLAEGSDGLSALWTNEGARLPVIIEFAMPPIADAPKTEDPESIDAPRIEAVRGGQDAILGSLFGSEAEIARAEAAPDTNLKRMTYTPFFGMVATAQDVEKLSADPRVVRIHEDAIADISLAQSRNVIGMANAYIQGATGQDLRVAILDTGGRRSHEFLSRQIISAACYSSTTGAPNNSTSVCPGGVSSSTDINSANDCDSGAANGCSHGTHVAGTAAGYNTNQQQGEVAFGVAREARIISINVFSRFPGPEMRSFSSDQISGLERVYALRTTMSIAAVNMSLGGGQHFSACDTNALKPIIDLLRAANIATVIAAGNDGFDTSVGAPGCISTAITVASSTKADVRSGFSNWGTLIDVVAPGSDINASYVTGPSNTTYASLNGTSMATPHVVGAFAALRSVRPWATVDQIEAALKSTGLAITSAGTTKPRIRVDLALAALPTLPPPPNDNFAQRTIISGPTPVTGNNTSATAEAGEPLHFGRSNARNSVWWRYTPSFTGPVTIDTFGSAFDTVLAVYTGNAVNALTEVASNDDAGGGNRSSVTFQGTAGTAYNIAVAGYGNTAGPITINIVPPPPPNDNFANPTLFQVSGTQNGTTVGATAETGEPNHAGVANARNSVWWRFAPLQNGQVTINTTGSNFDTVLAVYTGATVSTLTSVVSNDDTGGTPQSSVTFQAVANTSYAIAVAGKASGGGISITLQFTPAPQGPANDNFANRANISSPRTLTATNVNATEEPGEPIHAGRTGARTSVWWRYTPATSGEIVIDTFGSAFDTVLAVYTGTTLTNLTPVASNDDDGPDNQSRVAFQGTAGTAYAIVVAGFSNASGAITLTLAQTPPPPANDNFANRVTIAAPGTVTGTNVGATAETGEPTHAGDALARKTVWWRHTPAASGRITIDTFDSDFNTVLAVYTGSSVTSLTPVADNDDANAEGQSRVSFQATAGVSYAIVVAGSGNDEGAITIALAFTQPPANDNFADRITIPEPGTAMGSNVGATAETGEPNHHGNANARTSVWWRYTPAASGEVVIDTIGSAIHTVLAVYTGSTLTNLVPVASADEIGDPALVTFQGTAGTSYAIAVAGDANAEGLISVTVTNLPPPRPANDNFSNRITLPGPGTVAGTNVSATAETGEPNHAGNATARKTVWWRYTPAAAGQVTLDTFGSDFDTVLAVYRGGTVGNLTPVASNDDFGGNTASQVTFQGAAGTSYAIAVAGHSNASGIIALTLQLSGGPAETTVVAAVTPVARATQVGSTVTAFATMINSGAAAAASCSIAVPAGNPVTFEYRSRNHNTGALGPVNQPVNIAAGARQDFLMSFRPTGALQQELALIFDCVNTAPAGSVLGLNTFLLIGTTGAPPADLLSIAVTPTNDGIMNIPLGGSGFAALAAQNIGATATLQARLSASSILSAPTSLAGTMVICRTNPTTGACLATPAATVNFTANAAEMVTFTAFVASNGTEIPFNPGATRLFVHFFQGSTPVGSASVAARTVAPPPDGTPSFVAAR